MLGKTLGGRYQITHHLGGGGFGQTYLAEDLHLPGKPTCVVKQFKPNLEDPRAFQAAQRLFDVEAQTLYALGSHDQIPQLFAHFEESSNFFLVQEFIEGDVLNFELQQKKRYSEAEIISLLQDVLTVLEFVHAQNVIHRDIKPSNLIRRRRDQRLVLIDFGAVKQIGVPLEQLEDNRATITIAVGSSGYMPNEQIAGKPRFSSDIYAVGMLVIQCLTGVYPKKLVEDPITSEIVWRDQIQVSVELANIIDQMVRYDFRQRFLTAKEALAALHGLTQVAATPMPVTPKRVALNDSYLAWLERGDELFQRQRYREAVIAYERVLQANADEYVAWFKRGICLENLSRFDEAATAYDRVVQLQPGDYLAWYRRGNVLAQLHQFAAALESYNRVLEIQPDNYWAWHDQGKVLENMRQLDGAIAAYDRAVQLKPDFSLAVESRKRVLSQLRRVDDLFHLQHYDEALISCDRAIQLNSKDSLAWLMRGMALDNLHRYDEAIAAYDQVVAIQPDDHVAWFKRGNTLEKLQQFEAAIASYYRVVQLQPDNHWAWHDRGRLSEQLGHVEAAMAAYERASQVRPDFQPAMEGRKRLLHQLQNQSAPGLETAESNITEIMQQEQLEQPAQLTTLSETSTTINLLPGPNVVEQHLPLAIPELEAEEGETIIGCLSVGKSVAAPLASSPKPPVRDYPYWLNHGRGLEKLQRYSEVLAACDRAHQLRRDQPESWRLRGNALCALNRYREAHAAYEQALQLDPNNAELWFCSGNCLTRLKLYSEAIAAFEQAIAQNPDTPNAWYCRGRVLCELKQYAEAVKSFNQALVLRPDFQPALDDRQYLLKQLKIQRTRRLSAAPMPSVSSAH